MPWLSSETDLIPFLHLVHTKGFGPHRYLELLETYTSLSEFLSADSVSLQQHGWTPEFIAHFTHARTAWNDSVWDWVFTDPSLTCLTYDHPDYPPLLRELKDAPLILFVRGDTRALQIPTLSVVGTRKPSPYGRKAVETLVPPIVRAGIGIVSGLAYGIDGYAHETTLEHHGVTIAVVPGSTHPKRCTPTHHSDLAERILAQKGAIISEDTPETVLLASSFPRRNRILVGLSRALLVVEAAQKSGSLVSAQIAINSNRDVLCVPGPIDAVTSEGCHILLRSGATLISEAADILEYFPECCPETVQLPLAPTLQLCTPEEEVVYNQIRHERSVSLDQLTRSTPLSSSLLLRTLSRLELSELIREEDGYYRLTS